MELSENEIAKELVNICFNIHKQYGLGLFESVYEEIVCHELYKTGMFFKRQQSISLVHETIKLDVAFRADIIVENRVLVELKSVENLTDVHHKQVLTYLKLTSLKLGLLINFNSALIKNGMHRIVNNL